ncbi:transcription intermediary factor 1-alpha-like isoform X2 [Antennarius striatus]|uniref:transcription intermediary factor 1-alpha-like isoform X2 n=1 Tax=Antennarius striatus TaxID=241820 RepID=UPI0035B02637
MPKNTADMMSSVSPLTLKKGASLSSSPHIHPEARQASCLCFAYLHVQGLDSEEMEKALNLSCRVKTRASSPTRAKQQRRAGKDVVAFLQRTRIHPQAQRILGNACIPVVILERLNFRSGLLSSSLQPVVSLVRLPCRTRTSAHVDSSCGGHPQETRFHHEETCGLEAREAGSNPAEPSDLSQSGPRPSTWTEPSRPDSPSSEEPEQDSGFDCESNPDQPYILLDEWDPDGKPDSETFYLDPDPEQTLVIQLDPDLEVDQDRIQLELEDDSEARCEVVQVDDGEDQTQEELDPPIQNPRPGSGPEESDSEDFCAVCLNGGDLLCCDRCPKVFHLSCHIPPVTSCPLGDWMCSLCRTDQEPSGAYSCEDPPSCGGVRAPPYTLSPQNQRRCEKLTLMLYCHALGAPFHDPVSPLARNYYQIIRRPINLSVIRRKLDKSNTLHYFTPQQFVDDVLLMFKNCATFNYPDSEVAQAGQNLEGFFLSKLQEVFPEQTFPSASQDTTDRVRLRWLSRRRKRWFSGKKYYL